jgi:hypothetical protein
MLTAPLPQALKILTAPIVHPQLCAHRFMSLEGQRNLPISPFAAVLPAAKGLSKADHEEKSKLPRIGN